MHNCYRCSIDWFYKHISDLFLILKQLADTLFLGCFYTMVVAVHHYRDLEDSLVDHYVCVTVTAAHLFCH